MGRSSGKNPMVFSQQQLDLLPTPIFFKNLDGVFIGCNKAFASFLGLEQQDILDKTVRDIAPPELAEKYEEMDKLLLEEGGIQTYEYKVPGTTDNLQVVRFTKAVLRDENGHPQGIVGQFFDISDLHQTQNALSMSHATLMNALEHIPASIHVANRNTYEVLFMNRLARDAYGSDPQGKPCWEVFHNRTSPCPACEDEQPDDPSSVVSWEDRNPITGKWSLNHKRPIHWLDAPNARIQVSMDITESKFTSELFASRLRLVDMAADHSLEELLIATIDEAEHLTESGIGFFHFLSHDQEELLLQAWSTRTTSEMCTAEGKGSHYHVSRAGVWVDCIRERKTIVHNDYESLTHKKGLPKGHAPIIRELVTPIFRDDRIVAILGVGNKPVDYDEQDIQALTLIGDVAWDISQRKIAEMELAETLDKLSFHIDNSPLAVIEWQKGTHIKTWSQQAETIFGWKAEEVLGKNWSDFSFIHPDDLLEVQRQTMRLFDGKDQYNTIRNRNYRKDRTVVHCQWYNSVRRDDKGNVLSILSQVADISEMKKVEHRLLLAKEQAEAANKAKSNFLANMSHEVRTPLNGIMGMLQLLQRTPLTADQNELITTALQSSHRLTRLLSDILDLSQVEANRLSLRSEPFNLIKTIKDTCELFRVTAEQADVSFSCTIVPGTPHLVIGDSMRLAQVLNNLLGNAFKFTKDGEISVEVSPIPVSPAGRIPVLFSVSDTGIGIPEEKMQSLFKPFSQVSEGYKREFQGAGLGLSICKQLIDLMKGTLATSSELGVGTTVYFTIPFEVETSSLPLEYTKREPQAFTGDSLTILLAEDDEVNRMAVTRMLESSGHDVTSVVDGKKALDLLRERTFDMVLMDIQMPVMDGIEATRSIRQGDAGKRQRDIPIIALTAYAMPGDEETFLRAGVDAYLPKPLILKDFDRLVTTLGHAR